MTVSRAVIEKPGMEAMARTMSTKGLQIPGVSRSGLKGPRNEPDCDLYMNLRLN